MTEPLLKYSRKGEKWKGTSETNVAKPWCMSLNLMWGMGVHCAALFFRFEIFQSKIAKKNNFKGNN